MQVKRVMVPDYREDEKGAMVFGRGPPPPEQVGGWVGWWVYGWVGRWVHG